MATTSTARAPKLTKKELEKYRRLLEEKKSSLSAELAKTRDAEEETTEESTQDIADKAVSSYTREFLYSLSDSDRTTLLQIDEALGRIDEGTYGLCANCGAPMSGEASDGGSLGALLRRLPGAVREGAAGELSRRSGFAGQAPASPGPLFCPLNPDATGRLRPCRCRPFARGRLPSFDAAPSVVLISGASTSSSRRRRRRRPRRSPARARSGSASTTRPRPKPSRTRCSTGRSSRRAASSSST